MCLTKSHILTHGGGGGGGGIRSTVTILAKINVF